MHAEFEEIITSRERLREIIKEPSPKVSHKAIDHLDEICARFPHWARKDSLPRSSFQVSTQLSEGSGNARR